MMILAQKDPTIIQALNMCIFLGKKKYGKWGDFSEKFQVLCKTLTKLHDLTVYIPAPGEGP